MCPQLLLQGMSITIWGRERRERERESVFSSVQFKRVYVRSEKPIVMHSTPSPGRRFPNATFETVPMCVYVCVRACACVRACVSVRVRVCVRARACVCV